MSKPGAAMMPTLFFFQAEDGIRDLHVTGVQTCALPIFRRCILLWSNRHELVLDPFAGIGTTGYVAIQNDRRFVGCELKRSYFEAACRNIDRASGVLDLGLFEAVPA